MHYRQACASWQYLLPRVYAATFAARVWPGSRASKLRASCGQDIAASSGQSLSLHALSTALLLRASSTTSAVHVNGTRAAYLPSGFPVAQGQRHVQQPAQQQRMVRVDAQTALTCVPRNRQVAQFGCLRVRYIISFSSVSKVACITSCASVDCLCQQWRLIDRGQRT